MSAVPPFSSQNKRTTTCALTAAFDMDAWCNATKQHVMSTRFPPQQFFMKRLLVLLFLACVSGAVPLFDPFDNAQLPLSYEVDHPDFHLDLRALRLVEMEGKAPMWMTELEKVIFPIFL